MQRVYLVQHGQAFDKTVEVTRPLTPVGRQETERIAELAAKLDLPIREIRHSGKKRAEETAVIFARALGLLGNVTAVSRMGPTDNVQPIAAALEEEADPVMLVGHKPFMPRLAAQLIYANIEETEIAFRYSGIVAIKRVEPDGAVWQADWQLNPL